MARFAERTKVPVDETRLEIERTLKKFGADRFAYYGETWKAVILFEAKERRLKFELPLPGKSDAEHRRRWRALLLAIKAKLSSVESNIESFEEAFLSHVVMPDGKTVGDHTRARIAAVYKGGEMAPLLPPPAEPDRKRLQ